MNHCGTRVAPSAPARHIARADNIADIVRAIAANPNVTGAIVETVGGARLVSMG